MIKPYEVICINKETGKIELPTLLLMTRSFNIIGKIPKYEEWNISLVGNGIDEITFKVSKYADGKLCPVWDDLIDLKIVDVKGFGRFEISVDYTDNTKTEKSIHGYSLEVELGQIPLYELHINDDDAMDMELTEYSQDNYDSEGNYIPTVFYNPDKPANSLLHRVLADKAPHWSIGYVTPYIALSEEEQPEPVTSFQRTYTCDGETIYDFLTGTVAEESNVVFIFDTINRRISCYSLCDCIDQETRDILAHGIGEDTKILISKNKLANEITISSDKDSVKNCFRIEGGDDVITDMVRVVNMNGSNYIYQFSNFQYDDMSPGLVEKIKSYQELMEENKDIYYGEDGIYTNLCKAYDDLYYYESGMMPSVNIDSTSAEKEYDYLFENLNNSTVAVSSVNNYDDNLFVGVTNNVEAMAQILVDSRYEVDVVDGTTSYSDSNKQWKGKFRITRKTDETELWPVDIEAAELITVNINDDEIEFARQKLEKSLKKGDMLEVDFKIQESPYTNEDGTLNIEEITGYFQQYALNRLKSFRDGYNSCLSIIMSFGQEADGTTEKDFYDTYYQLYTIVKNVTEERQTQVDAIYSRISDLVAQQSEFQDKFNFQKYLGDYYTEFCSYRREDSYSNDNYISDGLSDSECLSKAKELVDVAIKEIKEACVLQRTVSTSLSNLFALPEFEPLYDQFALFNYIRVRTEDEILKLRLIGIDFDGNSISDISVTFSEKVESVDGLIDDTQSIIQQAGSIASSYSSTVRQAKQGAEAKSDVLEMYTNGLDAAKTMLTNNDSNEVTYSNAGIICKRMDDEGHYGWTQLRIVGNGIYMTDDEWASVKMALGEIQVNGETKYGVIADTIIGKLIAGNSLVITNDADENSASVVIDENGITIKNGLIQSDNYEENVSGSKLDLTNGLFNFGGGSLTWDGAQLKVTGDITATNINATNSGTIAGYTIDGDMLVGSSVGMSGKNGQGYAFWAGSDTPASAPYRVDHSGNLYAITGTIGAWNFNSTSIWKGNSTFAESNGMYFGDNGLSIKDTFTVNKDGELWLKSTREDNSSCKVYVSGGIFEVVSTYGLEESIIISQQQVGQSNHVALWSDYIECWQIGDYAGTNINFENNTMNANGMTVYGEMTFNSNVIFNHSYGIYGKSSDGSNSYSMARTNKSNSGAGGTAVDCVILGSNQARTYLIGSETIYTNHSLSTYSDQRLKKDFENLDSRYLDMFDSISPVLFHWKDEGIQDNKHIGYIANKVLESMNDAGISESENNIVHRTYEKFVDDENEQETLSLSYDSLGVVTAYALQDSRRKIKDIEKENELLKEKINNLEQIIKRAGLI